MSDPRDPTYRPPPRDPIGDPALDPTPRTTPRDNTTIAWVLGIGAVIAVVGGLLLASMNDDQVATSPTTSNTGQSTNQSTGSAPATTPKPQNQ